MMTTELTPTHRNALRALKERTATLAEVASQVADPLPSDSDRTTALAFPPVAAPVVLDAATRTALNSLPEVFARVQPTERRALTESEIAALYVERDALAKSMATLRDREDQIKEAIRTHLDVTAEKDGQAFPSATSKHPATPREESGHYLLASRGKPARVQVPGSNVAWSLEYREAKATVSGSLLDEMHAEGTVSREDYLAFTREVRVFDETKAAEAIVVHPERLEILRRITKPGKPSTSLFVRKAT
jgi:hypothetical protein